MTPEKQRIAIAEFCGWWQSIGKYNSVLWTSPNGEISEYHRLPDYLSDLNAIHEAEKLLSDEQCDSFGLLIIGIMSDNGRSPHARDYCDWHATAAQRALALLRTIGWEEEKP